MELNENVMFGGGLAAGLAISTLWLHNRISTLESSDEANRVNIERLKEAIDGLEIIKDMAISRRTVVPYKRFTAKDTPAVSQADNSWHHNAASAARGVQASPVLDADFDEDDLVINDVMNELDNMVV